MARSLKILTPINDHPMAGGTKKKKRKGNTPKGVHLIFSLAINGVYLLRDKSERELSYKKVQFSDCYSQFFYLAPI